MCECEQQRIEQRHLTKSYGFFLSNAGGEEGSSFFFKKKTQGSADLLQVSYSYGNNKAIFEEKKQTELMGVRREKEVQ